MVRDAVARCVFVNVYKNSRQGKPPLRGSPLHPFRSGRRPEPASMEAIIAEARTKGRRATVSDLDGSPDRRRTRAHRTTRRRRRHDHKRLCRHDVDRRARCDRAAPDHGPAAFRGTLPAWKQSEPDGAWPECRISPGCAFPHRGYEPAPEALACGRTDPAPGSRSCPFAGGR